MGNTLLEWKEPILIYRTKHKPNIPFLIVCMVVLIALLIRNVLQRDYFDLFQSIFVICILWYFNRVVPTYKIGDAGISYQDGHSRQHLKWSDIEWYYLAPEETAPDMMHIQFSVRKARWWKVPPAFVFDPQEIDEKKLLHILQ